MKYKYSLLLLLTAIIWGAAFVAQSAGMDYVGPFTFNTARYYLGVIALLPVIVIKDFKAKDNIIYAFTLSPQDVIDKFEKMTPSLDARIKCVNNAISQGAKVRLCFDPLVYIKDFELCYNGFTDMIIESIDLDRVKDIGIGTFRISSDYLGNLKKASPDSAAVLFPFVREDGFCVYPKELRDKLIGIPVNKLKRAGYGNKLYVM